MSVSEPHDKTLPSNLGPEDRSRAEEKRVNTAEEAKRSFLRMVSHELRTPLNSIIGFSEIIRRELYGPIGDARYRDHAELIWDSGHKLLKLVNQVVEIARLETGVVDLDLAPDMVLPAVDDVLQVLEPVAIAKGLDVRVEIEPDLPPVMADARGLRTLLTKLIENAFAFAPEQSAVTVAAMLTGETVTIAIRDHGEGIAPEDVARLMRPFEQGEAALTRRVEGAGLGLPTAKLLVDAMGGRLRLQRAQGGGLVASVRLPRGQM